MNTRRKGNRLEFDTQKWMRERLANFKRIGMSGQLEGLKGDFQWVEGGEEFRGEAKSGKQVPKKIYDWLEKDDSQFLVVKRDRKRRLWILTDELLEKLLRI